MGYFKSPSLAKTTFRQGLQALRPLNCASAFPLRGVHAKHQSTSTHVLAWWRI